MDELVLRPLADAFLQVGVPVALLAAATAWARLRYGTRALGLLARHPVLAPLLGALLGVVPGCAGAILVVALYLKRRASYGAAVGALTATMGDASFVLIAVDPALALALHGVLLAVGTVTGYAVDAVRFDPRRALAAVPVGVGGGGASLGEDEVRACGCDHHGPVASRGALRSLPPVAAVLWVTAVVGAVLALPASLQLLDPMTLAPAFGGLDPWLVVGVTGAVACAVLYLGGGLQSGLADDDRHADPVTGLLAGARETAFITFWVAVAFVAQALLSELTPFDGSGLPLLGVAGVVVGVVVALIPGCGTQIAFTGLYAAGALPLPALLANAVAQDGDALLPVIAHDRRTAVVTTVLTSVPALVAGGVALLVV